MRPSRIRPIAQLFVCTNARGADDPLRSGCGAQGPAVFAALKRRVIDGGVASKVWVTSTGCLGQCPPSGCSVTLYPRDEHMVEVTVADIDDVLRLALTTAPIPQR